MNEREGTLAVDILEYEGPLDLLNQLIERNRIPVSRVSIVSIADQYLEIIRDKPVFDMELASSFLLMAATLIHLKSAMLLPDRPGEEGEDVTDPGDLLVMRLLQYRRCRLLASQLGARHAQYRDCFRKAPTPPERLGVLRERTATRLERDRFEEAGRNLALRNENRFDDSSKKVEQILERERISLAERMLYIVKHIAGRSRIFFYELFPPELPPIERITGFLAVLELVFQNKARVTQKKLFSPIMIERKGR
ncbi:MAG TPA: segregation/condensation protein A [Clostridiaceae bacterium]|nr:segregation/condensation protein A [Clostridiaceae bacterium]